MSELFSCITGVRRPEWISENDYFVKFNIYSSKFYQISPGEFRYLDTGIILFGEDKYKYAQLFNSEDLMKKGIQILSTPFSLPTRGPLVVPTLNLNKFPEKIDIRAYTFNTFKVEIQKQDKIAELVLFKK